MQLYRNQTQLDDNIELLNGVMPRGSKIIFSCSGFCQIDDDIHGYVLKNGAEDYLITIVGVKQEVSTLNISKQIVTANIL